MTSTDALILQLSSDLPRVQRRRASRDAAALLALSAAELALVVLTAGLRPDMGRVIGAPFMIWKIGSVGVLAGLSCAVAIRSFAPPTLPTRNLKVVFGLAILAIIAGLTVTPTADLDRPLLARLAPAHGLACSSAIVVLSLPLMAMLGVLMRRAELPPSEWSIDYDSLDQGRDVECLQRSTSPRKSSGSCVRWRSWLARAVPPRRRAVGSRSANRPRPSPGQALLSLAQRVWRPEDGSGASDEGFGEGEPAAAPRHLRPDAG